MPQPALSRRRAGLLLLSSLPLAARGREPWQVPPARWSKKDVRQLLTDSPWTRPALIRLGTTPMPSPPLVAHAPSRGISSPTVDPVSSRSLRYRVCWASAIWREAVSRDQDLLRHAPPLPELDPASWQRPGFHTLVVFADPQIASSRRTLPSPTRQLEMMEETVLLRANQPRLRAATLTLPPSGPIWLVARFPHTTPILRDEELIIFRSSAAPGLLRAEFHPGDMLAQGVLDV